MAAEEAKKNGEFTEEELKQWKDLYEQAAELRDLRPWQDTKDLDLITVELPEAEEAFFCSISGYAGNRPAIHVLPGMAALQNFYRLAASQGEETRRLTLERQQISCFFADRESVPEEQYKLIRRLDLKFRGTGQWIVFEACRPGYLPRMLFADEVKILARVFKHLLAALRKQREGLMKADFEKGRTIVRYYDLDANAWNCAEDEAFFPDLDYPVIAVPKDEAMDKAKKQPRNKATLELDLFYLPQPVESQEEAGLFFYPRMLLLADQASGKLYYNDLLVVEDAASLAVFTALSSYMLDQGRPKRVLVTQKLLQDMLKDFGKVFGVEIQLTDKLPGLEAFRNKIFGSR